MSPTNSSSADYNNHLSFVEKCNFQMMYQIFNSRMNYYHDISNISNMFCLFKNVLDKTDNTQHDFYISLSNSNDCFLDKTKIYCQLSMLEVNNSSSFIIITVRFIDHIVPIIIRKIFHSYYSLIVVSKTRKTFLYNSIIDYSINDSKIMQAIAEILNESENKSYQSMYPILDDYSFEHYNLKIRESVNNNNFFLKEIETAIKFSYTTRNYKAYDFVSLKNSTSPFFNLTWGNPSKDFYQLLINMLKKMYPKISKDLEHEYSVYKTNKHFFVNSEFNDLISNSHIMNINTLIKIKDIISKNIHCIENLKLKSSIDKIFSVLTAVERLNFLNKNKTNFIPLKELLNYCEEHFPIVVKQVKYEFHLCYIIWGILEVSRHNFSDAMEYFKNSIELNPNNSIAYVLMALSITEKAISERNISSDFHNFNKSINHAKKYLDRVIILYPNQIESLIIRAFCNQLLCNEEFSLDIDLAKAISISPTLKNEIENHTLLTVVQSTINSLISQFFSQIDASRILKSSNLGGRKNDFPKVPFIGYFKHNISRQKEIIESIFKKKNNHVDPNSSSVTSRKISFG